jgi:hypothetical protein
MGITPRVMPVMVRCAAPLLFAGLFVVAACHSEPTAPQDARVLIVDPASEQQVPSGEVKVKVFVERFELVDAGDGANVPGQGHIVYYRDVTPPLVPGTSALTADGTYAISSATSHTWSDVSPGQHTFWVQLVNDDNTALEPPAAVRVDVVAVE